MLDRRATAILCCVPNSITAGVLEYLDNKGLRVPEDVSLVAFDESELASVKRPQLTVISRPIDELALRAARMITSRLETPGRPPRTEVVRMTLKVARIHSRPGRCAQSVVRPEGIEAARVLDPDPIREVTCFDCSVPLPRPLLVGDAVVDRRSYAVVRIRTETGLDGAAYAFARGLPVAAIVEGSLAPLLAGRRRDGARIDSRAAGGSLLALRRARPLHSGGQRDRPRPLGHPRTAGGAPARRSPREVAQRGSGLRRGRLRTRRESLRSRGFRRRWAPSCSSGAPPSR